MTWTYHQSDGDLYLGGEYEGRGYSGHGAGLNNGVLEAKVGVGPIPKGRWTIGPAHLSQQTGPVTMALAPNGHSAHGRSAFEIHGDNRQMNHSASDGCIILGRAIRDKIAASGDHDLDVVA